MTASSDENKTQPLSQDEIARLDALKSHGALGAVAIVAITLLMVWTTWERYGAFLIAVAVVAGLALAALTALVSWATNANLQADMDGGIKRLAVAKVAKVTHDGEQSRYRIELRTEETPPCTLEFDPPALVFFEVEYGEQVRVAYAPASKTVISVVAVGCEYDFAAPDLALRAALEPNSSADSRLQLRRAQRDAARALRRKTLSAPSEPDLQQASEALRPEAAASIEDTPQRQTGTLNKHERDTLAARRTGGCGMVALLGVGLIFVAVLMLADVKDMGAGAIAVVVAAAVLAAALIVFVVSNEDDKLQADLDTGVKLSIRGRISHMRTESSEGGSPSCFITVTVDESPPRTIVFLVEARLFHALLPEDAVRIVYVPTSKTILHLRTDSYSYSLRREAD
ncbi:hypothetical protein [Lysobacter capsici]|uniref:hypothetical protein n=1 Tax=Lysobacter capsici TaxID=435897 RepID=UPI001C003048|nr:hypothetical protein [Lysobacter capsici]MBW8808263.1 hypothetical protein [Lysobacter sp.]QWF15550.1 hypothetical protein KME82_17400 [Lysobacter capsici]